MIGDDIFFTILRFHSNQVALAFEAPASVIIHRDEIYKRIQEEKRESQKLLTKDNTSRIARVAFLPN